MFRVSSPRSRKVRLLCRWIVAGFSHFLARVHIFGREHIPEPPFIAVGNHFGNLEPPLMILSLPYPIDFLASGDIPFEGHVAWGPWLYGYIPTKRLSTSPLALRQALRSLRSGNVLGLFPEGRADRNIIRPPKPGVAYLGAVTGVPILPMGFSGLDRVVYQRTRGYRPDVYVIIGPPLRIPPPPGTDKRAYLQQAGMMIMERIAAMVDPAHRGEFKNLPHVQEWDSSWGWRAYLGEKNLPPYAIDFNKMTAEEVPEEAIPHRTLGSIIKNLFMRKGK